MNARPAQRRQSQTYQIPQRFGAGGMLAIIFVFSVLFGVLHRMDARGGYYLFFAVLGLVVGLSQMRGTSNPRLASIMAGAVVLPPAIFLAIAARSGLWRALDWLPFCLLSTVFGAGIGYLAGAVLGGAFLIADYLERYFDPRQSPTATASPPPIILAEEVTAESSAATKRSSSPSRIDNDQNSPEPSSTARLPASRISR